MHNSGNSRRGSEKIYKYILFKDLERNNMLNFPIVTYLKMDCISMETKKSYLYVKLPPNAFFL